MVTAVAFGDAIAVRGVGAGLSSGIIFHASGLLLPLIRLPSSVVHQDERQEPSAPIVRFLRGEKRSGPRFFYMEFAFSKPSGERPLCCGPLPLLVLPDKTCTCSCSRSHRLQKQIESRRNYLHLL